MKQGLLLYAFAIIFAITGCNRHADNPHLVYIDSLIHQKEFDKAYREVLQYADQIDTTNEADLAYYYLLRTRCQDCLKIGYDTEEGILKSVAYYKANGNNEKLLLAHHYAGIVQYHAGKKTEGVKHIKTGEAIAIQTGDVNMQTEAAIYLSYINSKEGNNREALIHINKALKLAKTHKNYRRIGYCYNHLAVLFSDMDIKDSCRYYSNLAEKYIVYQEPWEQVRFYNNSALAEMENKHFDKAIQLAEKSLTIENIPHTHYILAAIYHKLKKEDLADAEWKRALKETNLRLLSGMVTDYAKWLTDVGRKDEANQAYLKLKELEDSLKKHQQGENVLSTLHSHEKTTMERQWFDRAKRYILIISLLLCLLICYGIYSYRKRKHQQDRLMEIERQLLIYEQQEEMWKVSSDSSQKDIEILENNINKLREEQERDWKQLKKRHNKTVERLQQKIEDIKTEFPQRMAKGKELFDQVVANQNVSQWDKDERECFFMYCSVYHPDIMAPVEKDENNIKGNVKLYCILLGLGKSDEDIANIMHLSPAAFRMMKSRYNKMME